MDARAEITDFWVMVFNPSSVDRLTHVWIGAFLAGAFLVLSVHAYYLLKGRYVEISKRAFKIALAVATVFSLAQLVTGHDSANGVAKNQPVKLAAMEGHFDSLAAAPAYVVGWVDKEEQKVTGIGLPGGLSFLLSGDFEKPVIGLNAFPEDERPPAVNAVFQFYHLMVGIGMLLIALTVFASIQWARGRLFEQRWLLHGFVWAVILPQLANQFGWFTAEMGRQPWVVYGLLRTSDALSETVQANQVLFSLIMFTVIYAILFALFIYLLNKKIKNGPYDESELQGRPQQRDMAGVAGK
jgi:cytochrome d ubiquinol oxidase subunit I